MLIKQSTAVKVIPFFLVDSTDHITGKTGLTATVTISKNGGTFGAPAGAIAEIGNGWYRIAANATDSNTIGSLLVHATATGADPFDVIHEVVEATLAKGTDLTGFNDISTANVQTELTTYGAVKPTVAGRTLDISTTGEAGVDWANVGSPTTTQNLSATTISTSQAVASVSGAVGSVTSPVALTSAYDAAKLAAPAGAAMTLTSAYDAAKTAASQTSVNAVKTSTDNLATAMELDGAVYRFTTNALEQAPTSTGGGGGTDPWLTLIPGTYPAGSAGYILGNNLDTRVSTRMQSGEAVNLTPAYDKAKVCAVPGDAMTLTSGERTSIGIAVRDTNNATPASGSMGDAINRAASAGDPWGTILPGAYAPNSAGSLIGNNLDAKVSTRLPTSSYVVAPTANQNATATRDIDNTNPAANSLGAMVKAAGTSGDPWSAAIPGAYGAGTAGKILGTFVDVAISSRLAAASYVAAPTAAQNAAAVRDVSNASPAAGSLGADVKAGGVDPWGVLLPGSYGAGTAGFFVGDRLDAKTSTRLAATDFIPPVPVATVAAAVRDVDTAPLRQTVWARR